MNESNVQNDSKKHDAAYPHRRPEVQRRIARLLAARGLRDRMKVAAVGAIARITPELDVQKVSESQVIVRRGGRTRRCPL